MPEPAQQHSNPEPAGDLQFRRAVPIDDSAALNRCVACKAPIHGTYYHAAGQMVCPECAQRIQQGQQTAPPASLAKAFLYGGGAALAGCIIYALVAIVLHAEIGLVSILVGYMVGTAIRKASGGLGGRPQQILAVALTYFAITTSYIPVVIYSGMQKSEQSSQQATTSGAPVEPRETAQAPSLGRTLLLLALIAAAAPFLALGSGTSGILTIVIIFFGLSRAWRLTGRTDILVMGPYETAPGSA
jgi:hypothetical protein